MGATIIIRKRRSAYLVTRDIGDEEARFRESYSCGALVSNVVYDVVGLTFVSQCHKRIKRAVDESTLIARRIHKVKT